MIRRSDRVFITGASGTGKSVLARALFAAQAPPRLVVDPKDDPTATGGRYADQRDAVTFADPARLPAADSVRFVPRDPLDLEQYGRLFATAWERRGLFVWCDEAGVVMPSRGALPAAVARYVTQGRRWGSGLLALHQRPVQVSPVVLANCEHLAVFRLGYPDDVATVAGVISIPPSELVAHLGALPEHGFAWYAQRANTLTLAPPLDYRR